MITKSPTGLRVAAKPFGCFVAWDAYIGDADFIRLYVNGSQIELSIEDTFYNFTSTKFLSKYRVQIVAVKVDNEGVKSKRVSSSLFFAREFGQTDWIDNQRISLSLGQEGYSINLEEA